MWHYRVVKELIEPEDTESQLPARFSYSIRQVFLDHDNNPTAFTEEIIPFGESKIQLQEDLLRMLNAFNHPTIDAADI
jgi:hypothetical protein